jgi:hypothetical protein
MDQGPKAIFGPSALSFWECVGMKFLSPTVEVVGVIERAMGTIFQHKVHVVNTNE